MKKISLIVLGLFAVSPAFAKDDFLSFREAETTHVSGVSDRPRFRNRERIYNPSKTKSRLCWIPATVLAGSGGMICLFTAIFNPLAHERDPVRAAEMRKEQRTQMIVGGSLVAASIPLFALAIHYRNQSIYKTVLHFKLEPVDNYYTQSLPVPSVGLTIGL